MGIDNIAAGISHVNRYHCSRLDGHVIGLRSRQEGHALNSIVAGISHAIWLHNEQEGHGMRLTIMQRACDKAAAMQFVVAQQALRPCDRRDCRVNQPCDFNTQQALRLCSPMIAKEHEPFDLIMRQQARGPCDQ